MSVDGERLSENETRWLASYADLFDSIESSPLTPEQRRACVSDAPATLVLAGAGTGKTSTLTGRVAFLAAHALARPEDILCLAFAREAALEIQERLHKRLGSCLPIAGFTASTFHSLGLRIVKQVENQQPALTELCSNPQLLREFVDAQMQYQAQISDRYARLLFYYFAIVEPGVALSCEYAERATYQAACAGRLIMSMHGEILQHPFECLVANALCLMGVVYHYLKHFPHPVFTAIRKPYRSTFYLPDIQVYIDVLDYPYRPGLDPAISKRVQRIRDIHRCHQTRHILLWEDLRYIDSIEYLIWDLQQQLDACVGYPGNGESANENSQSNPPTNSTRYSAGNGDKSYRRCLGLVVGSARWDALLDEVAQLLPLYRQSGLQAGMRSKGNNSALAGMQRDQTPNQHPGMPGGMICDRQSALRQDRVPDLSTSVDPSRYPGIEQYRRVTTLLALLGPLQEAYKRHLRKQGEIDFDDMIQRATRYVRDRRFVVPWRDVLIDEFQDISAERFALIAAMLQQRADLRLFCVGDDWQAIYRFAGSDIRYCTQFADRVHRQCRIVPLTCTFRFNQMLCAISSQFLMKNPFQNRKLLHAARQEPGPVVTLARQNAGLAVILSRLQQQSVPANRPGSVLLPTATPTRSVLLLARFTHLLPDDASLNAYARHYPGLRIQASTVHASKGLEADYVFILNMEQGVYGFPSSKPIDAAREHLLPEPECFEHADERRLFYVALTRARKHVWLLVPDEKDRMSPFVKELLRDNKAVVNTTRSLMRPRHGLRSCSAACSNRLHRLSATFLNPRPTKVTGQIGGRLTHRQKLAVTRIVDKIKRHMAGIDVGTEKKNGIS